MNMTKRIALALAIATLALVGPVSCAWFHPEDIKPVSVAEGQDPVIVNLERIQTSSLEIYKQTTEWEFQNRAILPAEVSRAVDKMRVEFPKAWQESRVILQEYKEARGTDPTKVTSLTAALSAAQSSLLRLKVNVTEVNQVFDAINALISAVQAIRQPVIP